MNFPPPVERPARYRGRFAPTPSGPLHLGSLLTALAGWLDARVHGGHWLLRIDDLDQARCPPGAADVILRQLEVHGLQWDESPRWQSAHRPEYEAACAELQQRQLLYACHCTRAVLATESRSGTDGPVYSGHCRAPPGDTPARHTGSLRLRTPTGEIELDDPIQGHLRRNLEHDVGDFVLRRADGLIGYQLACVIDEAAQGINHVLRGADLIGSSLRQLLLQRLLDLPSPGYAHLPVLTGSDGRKLSKQNGAAALDPSTPADNLRRCLRLLGQPVPEAGLSTLEVLEQARERWRLSAIPRVLTLPETSSSPVAP